MTGPGPSSRFSGWHHLSREQRRQATAAFAGVDPSELAGICEQGGLDPAGAERLVEDVLGVYALPFAVAPNFLVAGREHLVPLVVEEPSVVAAAANGARLVRTGGGFSVQADPPVMTGQVLLRALADPRAAALRLRQARTELLALAAAACPRLVARGGGPVELEVRPLVDDAQAPATPAAACADEPSRWLVVSFHLDVGDAMGANLVDGVGEALAPRLAELAGGRVGGVILTNLAERRRVRVRAEVPLRSLQSSGFAGEALADGVVALGRWAELDPARAATHNKGLFNGLDAVLLATGNDWRAVEAGGHAWAARGASYQPLSRWRRGEGGELVGELELPLACGVVGGTIGRHRGAQLALRLLGGPSAPQLAGIAAATGLACNLAALRVLAGEGIQRGHHRLHRRGDPGR